METINEESNLDRNPYDCSSPSPILDKLIKGQAAWGKEVKTTFLNQNNLVWCKRYFSDMENDLISMKIVRQIILNQVMFMVAEYRRLIDVNI